MSQTDTCMIQRSAGSQGTGSVGSKSRTSRQEMSDTGSEISDGNILEGRICATG